MAVYDSDVLFLRIKSHFQVTFNVKECFRSKTIIGAPRHLIYIFDQLV